MKSNIRILSWIYFAMMLIISCGKEQSVEGIVSKGTLKSDTTGACLSSVVNGVYSMDSLITGANFINTQINILIPGRYSIHSDTVNGFSFKGEGFADTTGIRTVRLPAAGTPLAAGTSIFHITYGTSTCAIEVTVAGSGPVTDSAEYTFAGTSGCPQVSFQGTYKTGIVLDASAYMEFDVQVTKAGAYAFNTAPVNGISFSGSGIFATTGMEHIRLQGSGTPLSAGAFTIGLSHNGVACTYALPVSPADNTADAVYTINCAGAVVSGTYTEGVAITALNTVKITATVSSPGKYTLSTTVVNGLKFSGTATFTTASATPQTVTLVASGKPETRGTFDYTVTGNGNTCTFKVITIAAAGQAVFTLSGSPNACTTPVIAGTYTKGTALGAQNTMVIKTDVATAGAYSISTNTVNGIKFSGSGNFSGTGQQTITLTGTGTPTAAGVSTFTPQMGSSSCKFDVTVSAVPVTTGTFTCKIDGVFTTFNDRAGFTHEVDPLAGGYSLDLEGYVDTANGSTVTSMQLFITNNNGSQVKAGTYNVDGILLANGYRIEVDYTLADPDNSAVIWNTSSTIFPPPNPAFTIVVTSISATRVKGTFSGKVTNLLQGSTQLKTITEGVFDLPVQ